MSFDRTNGTAILIWAPESAAPSAPDFDVKGATTHNSLADAVLQAQVENSSVQKGHGF